MSDFDDAFDLFCEVADLAMRERKEVPAPDYNRSRYEQQQRTAATQKPLVIKKPIPRKPVTASKEFSFKEIALIASIAIVAMVLLWCFVQWYNPTLNSNSKPVHVNSYTRRDGTVVRSYNRRR